MDTMAAYAMARANFGKELKIFDWDKAAEIIRDKKPRWAIAGLKGDMENTAGTIYEDNTPITDDYTYLASNWATPILQIETDEGIQDIPCYRMKHEVPDWDSGTKWPNSAMEILTKGKEANEAIH